MRHFSVRGVNADGSPNTLDFDHVSEWSFKGLKKFFGEKGVILSEVPGTAYTIDDKPLWVKDPETGEMSRNTGQVM